MAGKFLNGGAAIGTGIALGVALGVALDNLALGIALGRGVRGRVHCHQQALIRS